MHHFTLFCWLLIFPHFPLLRELTPSHLRRFLRLPCHFPLFRPNFLIIPPLPPAHRPLNLRLGFYWHCENLLFLLGGLTGVFRVLSLLLLLRSLFRALVFLSPFCLSVRFRCFCLCFFFGLFSNFSAFRFSFPSLFLVSCFAFPLPSLFICFLFFHVYDNV